MTAGPAEAAGAFSSSEILPPYLRKTKSVEELIPWLYLKGISTGDFSEALAALLGPEAPGLSATTVTRLKAVWEDEYEAWSKPLAGGQAVRVPVGRRRALQHPPGRRNARQCILVLMGATADGKKELIAMADGYRESEQSWLELLLDVPGAGLELDPQAGDRRRGLGLLEGLAEGLPHDAGATLLGAQDGQRAGQAAQGRAAEGQGDAARDLDGRDEGGGREGVRPVRRNLTRRSTRRRRSAWRRTETSCWTFYDFPAEHWRHLRTTNPIESTFATVRLRTDKTKGSGSRVACLTMVFKLGQSAEKSWRLSTAPSCWPTSSLELSLRMERKNSPPEPGLIHNY